MTVKLDGRVFAMEDISAFEVHFTLRTESAKIHIALTTYIKRIIYQDFFVCFLQINQIAQKMTILIKHFAISYLL